MKRKYKITILTLTILILFGLDIANNIEADNKTSVRVSCTIPSLLEMNLKPENVKSKKTEDKTKETEDDSKVFIQEKERNEISEEKSTKLIYDSQSENSILLYSFYER